MFQVTAAAVDCHLVVISWALCRILQRHIAVTVSNAAGAAGVPLVRNAEARLSVGFCCRFCAAAATWGSCIPT